MLTLARRSFFFKSRLSIGQASVVVFMPAGDGPKYQASSAVDCSAMCTPTGTIPRTSMAVTAAVPSTAMVSTAAVAAAVISPPPSPPPLSRRHHYSRRRLFPPPFPPPFVPTMPALAEIVVPALEKALATFVPAPLSEVTAPRPTRSIKRAYSTRSCATSSFHSRKRFFFIPGSPDKWYGWIYQQFGSN